MALVAAGTAGVVIRWSRLRYEIAVENLRGVSRGITRAEFDGQPLSGNQVRVPPAQDSATHRLRVVLG